MGIEEKSLSLFTTRMRQLILHYNELKEENKKLRADNEQIKDQLTKAKGEYEMLMMAKMLEVGDGDMQTAQKRLAKLIRDVNKCITLLSE